MKVLFRKLFSIIIFSLISFNLFSQKEIDTTNIFSVNACYSLQLPGGDLANRFGINSAIGFGTLYKTKQNWIFYGFWDYKFGSQLKHESSSVLDNLKTNSGQIITNAGEYGVIKLSERGFALSLNFGKIIPLNFETNNYSGILFYAGPYFLQHKISIENDGNTIPEVIGEYVKGYDKLTNGFGVNEFIGYIHYSNNKVFNFFSGIELSQSFTKSKRTFDFNLRSKDNKNRTDYLFSIKIGFNIILSKRKTNRYYYF